MSYIYAPSTVNNAQKARDLPAQAKNIKMSQSVLANWAYSKFRFQITQNAISFIIKKRTDLESMSNNELSAKSPRGDQKIRLKEDLSTWVLQCQTRNVSLIGKTLGVKAQVFSERLSMHVDTIKFFSG